MSDLSGFDLSLFNIFRDLACPDAVRLQGIRHTPLTQPCAVCSLHVTSLLAASEEGQGWEWEEELQVLGLLGGGADSGMLALSLFALRPLAVRAGYTFTLPTLKLTLTPPGAC